MSCAGLCQNLALCIDGISCECRTGYYGTFCELRRDEQDPAGFAAACWTMAVLHTVLLVGELALVAVYLVKGRVRRVNKNMACLLVLALSSFFAVLSMTIDPFRFRASRAGSLTVAYNSGMDLFANLWLCMLPIAFAFLASQWISIRSQQRLQEGQWSVGAALYFWATLVVSLGVAALTAGLWSVVGYFFSNLILFLWMIVYTVVLCCVVFSGAALTLRDLRRFPGKHADAQRAVARVTMRRALRCR